MTTLRLITLDDADELVQVLTANREFLRPWEPARGDSYFTPAGQARVIAGCLTEQSEGRRLMLAMIGRRHEIIGQVTLSAIVRGAFQSGSIGYWVSHGFNGTGVATQAVAEATGIAFESLVLHRLQAETLPQNVASQRVLEKNGFERYGAAPAYLSIDGAWQDHLLYQRLNPSWPDSV